MGWVRVTLGGTAAMISGAKVRGRLLVGAVVLAGFAIGLSPAAVAGTPKGTTNGVRTEGSDADPVVVVDPRRGPVGTTVHVIGRCGPPLRVITVRFHRPANFERLGQAALVGGGDTFIPEFRADRTQFAGDFAVPARLFDGGTDRPVPVVPGRYVVDARCYGRLDARGFVVQTDLRVVFCVPECLPLSWAGAMNIHLESARWRLEDLFRTLIFIPPPIVATTTTTLPRPHAPQPSPPPPPTTSTKPSTTPTTMCFTTTTKPPLYCLT